MKIWAREKCTRLVDSVQWNLSVHCLVTGHNSDGDNLIVVQFMCFWKCPNKLKPEKLSDVFWGGEGGLKIEPSMVVMQSFLLVLYTRYLSVRSSCWC